MLLTRLRAVLVHVPKTAGSSLLLTLLPYSDARIIRGYFDQSDSYWGVADPVQRGMHAPLSKYREYLGDDFENYAVLAGFRDPFERMVSLYFSPHRTLRPHPLIKPLLAVEGRLASSWQPISHSAPGHLLGRVFPPRQAEIVWSEDEFIELVAQSPRHVDLIDTGVAHSQLLPLRFKHLNHDFRAAMASVGVSDSIEIPHIGVSSAPRNQHILESMELRRIVEQLHRDDYEEYQGFFE